MIKNILKKEKGSITVFVLVAVIFFLAIAFTAYASSVNKSQTQDLEFEKIKSNYENSYSDDEIQSLYLKSNKTVLQYATDAMPTSTATIIETDETKGIVMKDDAGNEWVWVEVPASVFISATSSIDYEGIYTDLNNYAIDYREGKKGQGRYWTDEWYDYLGTTYDGRNEYSQIKYITNSDYFTNAKNYYGKIYTDNGVTEATSYTEGTIYYAKITDKITDTSGCGLIYSDYNTAYKRMLSSIYTNKGFYISRYEAGIEGSDEDISLARTSRTAITSTSPKAVSKKDMIPYNCVYCSDAQKLANGMSTGTKTSSLLFGIQWDLTCKFLEVKSNLEVVDIKTDSTSWGNYSDSTFTIDSTNAKKHSTWEVISGEKSGSVLLTTGASEYTNKMNIYDFAGNEWEWTLEHTTFTDFPCSGRGGNYGHNGSYVPASNRYGYATYYSYDYNCSFRCSLY